MKVLMRSHLNDTNPYMRLLVNSLEAAGVTICPARSGRFFLYRSLRQYGRPDVFHLQWHHAYFEGKHLPQAAMRTAFFLLQLIMLKIMGVRLVWTVHNVVNHERHRVEWELFACRLMARLVNAIVVHCEAAVPIVAGKYKVSARSFHVVPHGHYIDVYAPPDDKRSSRTHLGLPLDDVLLLYFGQIRPYKGLEALTQAFGALDSDNVRLVVAGEPKSEDLRQMLEEASKHDVRILLHLDYIDDEQLSHFLSAADLIVLPYQEVLTSGAAILAASFERPVLVPSMGCLCELDATAAIYFDPNSELSLQSALKNALSAPLDVMGKAAREYVERASWSLVAARTLETYHAVCEG